MWIKMRTLSSDPERTLDAGGSYNVPDPVGRGLVDGGYAVQIERPRQARQPEAATVAPPEAATLHTERPKRRRG